MNWTKDKSIKLSMACLAVFAAVLLAIDALTALGWAGIGPAGAGGSSVLPAGSLGYAPGRGFIEQSEMARRYFAFFSATVAAGSLFAWPCLYELYRLLRNVQAGRVFTADTTRLLRRISWCCAGAAAVCLASSLYAPAFLIVAVAAATMMLIVRIVKNCFEQAIAMKEELDLTI